MYNEFFGGEIYSRTSKDVVVHYWNEKNGIKIDLTKQQFKAPLKFTNITFWSRDELLQTGDVAERYDILKQRVMEKYSIFSNF